MSQRHSNYYGFAKEGSRTNEHIFHLKNMFLRHLADFWCHFDAHWILKGVFKSSFLDIEANKMRKNGVIDRALKKHDFQLIFDVKIQGLM